MPRRPADGVDAVHQTLSTPPWRAHGRLILATGMASLLDSSAIVAVGLGLPVWRRSFELDVWALGAVSGTLTVAIALGALGGGRLADLLGRPRVFTATVMLYAAGAGLVALASTLTWLLVGVAVLGLASGADLPASLAVLTERTPSAVRGRLVAATHVLWTIGVLGTTAAGFAVSTAGLGGIRGIFAVLAVLALTTAIFRGSYATRHPPVGDQLRSPVSHPNQRTDRTILRSRSLLAPLLLTGLYYVLYTVVSSTFGTFKTYLLVVVCDATQSAATAISFLTGLLGLAGTVVFASIADSRWRSRVFPVGIAGYVVALGLLVVSGGAVLPVVVVALLMQNLAFPFVGDALYKVWTQEAFPVDVRATAQGLTICAARLGAGAFAFVTPALLRWSPSGLFALLLLIIGAVAVVGTILASRVGIPPYADRAPTAQR